MYKEKFIVTENGYYSGYSPNGTIPMSNEFNISNLPTENHKYNGTTWVLDNEKILQHNKEELCKQLDIVSKKIQYNEVRYGNQPQYAESYEVIKQELIAEQATLIKQL